MKKRVFAIALFTAIFALSVFAVGCGVKRFTVSVQFDSEYGSVTVTDSLGHTAESFKEGEKAVVTVKANDDYRVASFTVNGSAAELNDGVYEFNVNSATAVSVTFEKIPYFTVTSQFDSAHGAVAVTDSLGNTPESFKDGEKVVVTVKANDGYVVDSFTVNGSVAQLNNEVYEFNVSSDMTVNVSFETFLSRALKNAKTTFTANGTSKYTIEGREPELTYLKTVFGNDVINLVVTSAAGEIEVDEVYVNKNGILAAPYHTVDNEIGYYMTTDSYSEYDNPFKLLTPDDFTENPDNVYALTDEAKMRVAATAITGYNEGIESFTVTVSDCKINNVDITTKRIKRGSGENEFYYVSEYTFTLGEFGTAQVDGDKYLPFETKPEHTVLKNALIAAANAKNYTIDVHEEEPGYETFDYHTFVTENAIYMDLPKWEDGYVQSGNVVRHFSYDSEKEVAILDDAVKFPTIRSMRAGFTDFAPEIFERDEYGVYTLRDDCYTYQNVRDVLVNFAEGVDWIKLYGNYTYDVKLFVKNDMLYQVELVYVVPNMNVTTRTLTYRDFDNTEIPISFENCEFKSILDDYVGTYTDGSVTAVIDSKGITVNGAVFEVTDYSAVYGLFGGNWNGGVWNIEKFGKNQLLFYNLDDSITYTLTNTEIEPVAIPEEYNGVWRIENNTLAIAYNKAEYNGQMLTVLSYDEENKVLYAMRGDTSYRLFSGTKSGAPVIALVSYVDGMSQDYFDMAKEENAVIVPEVLIGTFEKEYVVQNYKYRAVIGLTAVTLELAGKKPTVSLVSASDGRYGEITLDVDGVEYTITEHMYTSEKITLYSSEDGCNEVLDRTEDVEPVPPVIGSVTVPESYYGDYMGSKDGIYYFISISADGIIVTMNNGEEKNAAVTEYDDYWDEITLDIDGEEYYIVTNYEDETAIDFSNSDYSIYVTLNRI